MFPQVNYANRVQGEITDIEGSKIGPVKKNPLLPQPASDGECTQGKYWCREGTSGFPLFQCLVLDLNGGIAFAEFSKRTFGRTTE